MTASSTKSSSTMSSTGATITAAASASTSRRRQRKPKMRASHQRRLSSPLPSGFAFALSPLSLCILAILMGAVPIMLVNSFDASSSDDELNFKATKYSGFGKNGSYVSDTSYNSGGMLPLYEITHQVILFIIGRDPLPEGYIEVKEDHVEFGPKTEHNQWGELILHNWPILLITILMALLIVTMPVIGLCFCCCRCAGNCGGRSEPFDKKHDTCRRVCLGFLLILLVIGILFGVIVAFVTNSFVQNGINRSTTSVRQGSTDTQEFLKHTGQQIDHVLVANYKELSNNLENILKETGSFLNTRLEQKSMAVSFKYLSEFLATIPDKKELLEKMRNITNSLRVDASQLSDGLRGVKRDLLAMLTKCNVKACQDVLNKYEIGTLDANGIHYNQIPDVSDIVDTMSTLISQDIASAGERGRRELDNLSQHLNNTIAQYIPQIMESLKKAGDRFQKSSNEVQQELQHASKKIAHGTDRGTEMVDSYLQEYAPYRLYAGIAVCSVLLLILLSLVIALLCGICGKRPGGYGDDCCNKGSGSRFLMIAVTLIFLTMSAILLFTYIHFLVGVVGYRGICMPMKDPQNDELFAQIDNNLDLNRLLYASQTKGNGGGGGGSGNLPPFRISHAIAACKANQTIYEVLRIHNRVDIKEIKDYPSQYKFSQTLNSLVRSVDLHDKAIVILSPEDKQRILDLANSPLKDYDSSKFIDNLKDTITKHSLVEIAEQLRQTANKITTADMKDVQVSLRNQALHLETYERSLVIPMKEQTAELTRLAHTLDKMMRYKDRPFEESIQLLVTEIERAQLFLNEEGRNFVKETANNLTRYFNDEIENYLAMVIRAIEKEIGLCQPLARVYDASYVGLCNRVIDPLNGFWAGVIWCCLLFLPTLCVAIKLAGLYQKSDPYPGPLVESEYLYDAYSERDQIPLANGPKNKRRKTKDRRRRGEYYEDPMGSTSQHCVPASAAAAVGGRDTRYNDMAPNDYSYTPIYTNEPEVRTNFPTSTNQHRHSDLHWDGGPPRYQNPPMAPPASEYERPPPYYYPGATEQD